MSDILVEAESLLEQLPDAVGRRRLGQRLSQAVTALRNVEHQVSRMAALVELAPLVEFGGTAEQRDLLEEMTETAAEIGEKLEIADSEETLRLAVHEYENGLPPAIRTLEMAVRERWRALVNERFAPMIGIGQLLSSMNVRDNLGGRLADCGREAQSATGASGAIELVGQVRGLLTDFEKLQIERAGEIGDDDVGEFINALAERRATLAMVTPKVHDWLEEHHALDRLGINPR